MANQNTPGVYIDEVATLGASVASVPTAVPGFTGYTEKAPIINGTAWSYTGSDPAPPVRITSLLEFESVFGGPKKATFALVLGGTVADPTITVTPTLPDHNLYYHMQLYFANGGGACYVVSAGLHSSGISNTALENGIAKFEQADEVTLLLTPETTTLTNQANRKSIYDKMLNQCNKLQDRFAIIDVYRTSGNTSAQDATSFRDNEVGTNYLRYGAAYYPLLNTSINYAYSNSGVSITTDGRTGASPAYTGKTLDNLITGSASTTINNGLANLIEAELRKYILRLYPCSAMAGVYAGVDATRGVWKAPANVSLAMVASPAVAITDTDQAGLNVDATSGKSVNAIRQFTGKGTLVWGARTLAGNDNEWRYVNVRRLFIYAEESIKKATEFVIFEPNTAPTWQRVKSMCEAFLTNLWRDGALAGASAKEAFFVRVGLGTTMTADDILNGRMTIEIGMAASRPAEFIILRFSHKLQES